MSDPDSPEFLYGLNPELEFSHFENGTVVTELVRAGQEVYVTGVNGIPLGVGRFLGCATLEVHAESASVPVILVQDQRLYDYECSWSPNITEEMRQQPTSLISDYLAAMNRARADMEDEDERARREMGIE